MRDWILEMRDHSVRIQASIDAGRNDEAWRRTHEFQNWCYERINAERYSAQSAGTLLSAVQTFLIRVLLSDGKFRHALVHTMYQGVLDGRNLKQYPKNIKSLFKKCDFAETRVETALDVYARLKRSPIQLGESFLSVQNAVASWK
jgi:hypothetical protein